jgi:hypothetical protein
MLLGAIAFRAGDDQIPYIVGTEALTRDLTSQSRRKTSQQLV